MKFFILIMIMINFSAYSESKERSVSEVWGKLIKVTEDQKIHGHQYFIHYTTADKKVFAYPIRPKNKQQQRELQKLIGKVTKISGHIKTEKIINDGQSVDLLTFIPDKLEPLKLSELGLAAPTYSQDLPSSGALPSVNNGHYYGGGIKVASKGDALLKFHASQANLKKGLSDKTTNIAIFTAGAVLLGSILSDYIK